MTPKELAAQLASFTPAQLGAMDHATLYSARQYVPAAQQNLISPYEHQAFAREATQENPLMALPIAAGTLAYQPYKMLMGARSGASMDQVTQGMQGVGQGLWGAFQDEMKSIQDRIASRGAATPAPGLLESLKAHLPPATAAGAGRQ